MVKSILNMFIIMFMNFIDTSDDEVLAELGRRLRRERLNNNLTRAALADQVGLSQDTVRNAETGRNVSLGSLIRILRGLNRLDQVQDLLAESGPSPVALARERGRLRQRASGSGSGNREANWKW